MKRTRFSSYEICIVTCDDRLRKFRVPYCVAWAAARGIARETKCSVVLYGHYGLAAFQDDGSGVVYWNDQSSIPGTQSNFDDRTTVAI